MNNTDMTKRMTLIRCKHCGHLEYNGSFDPFRLELRDYEYLQKLINERYKIINDECQELVLPYSGKVIHILNQ